MDRGRFQEWLDRYVAAWKSYDPAAIGELFSEDAEYYYGPFAEPVRGREAIVASWLDDRDRTGTYDGRYEPVLIDGDSGLATGYSRYFEDDGTTLEDEYGNAFLVRFDGEGRCREFREWWMQRPKSGGHVH